MGRGSGVGGAARAQLFSAGAVLEHAELPDEHYCFKAKVLTANQFLLARSRAGWHSHKILQSVTVL